MMFGQWLSLAGDERFAQAPTFLLAATHSTPTGVSAVIANRFVPICLGGDHSITYPILRAIAPAATRTAVSRADARPPPR